MDIAAVRKLSPDDNLTVPRNAVRAMIEWIGEDPFREGLRDTPDRVAKAYSEMFSGYSADVLEILSTRFKEVDDFDGAVSLLNIPFVSHCEHHMLPFYGVAHIAYVPSDRVVGISKLSRLVEAFARRLQIQERLCANIVGALTANLSPLGVAVAVDAAHMCMVARGVQQTGAVMRSSMYSGVFEASGSSYRSEFVASLPKIEAR